MTPPRTREPAPSLPAHALPDDDRDALELSDQENADLCTGCTRCCSYITVEIDAPRAAWEYDQWIWALHHKNVSLYVERPERWYLHFATVCEQLNAQGRCSIYGRHPVLCREYDPRSCERRLPLGDMRAWFERAEEFERWLEQTRPAHFRRLMAHRKDRPDAPPIADARADRAKRGTSLIPVSALLASTGVGANGGFSPVTDVRRRKREGSPQQNRARPRRPVHA